MTAYTNKPVVYLRVPSRLYALPLAETIVKIAQSVFKPDVTANSERDVLALRKAKQEHKLSVISLCKHAPGDINVDVSRVYDNDLKFVHFRGFKELSKHYSSSKYILFDEDIGGGYGIQCIKSYMRDFHSVTLVEATTIKFEPETEEVLDLKDFIYKFDNTAGLYIVDENKVQNRVSYIERFDILEKFASVKMECAEKVAIVFWVISAYYHKEFGNQSCLKECLDWLHSYQIDTQFIENELKHPYSLMGICSDVLNGNSNELFIC